MSAETCIFVGKRYRRRGCRRAGFEFVRSKGVGNCVMRRAVP